MLTQGLLLCLQAGQHVLTLLQHVPTLLPLPLWMLLKPLQPLHTAKMSPLPCALVASSTAPTQALLVEGGSGMKVAIALAQVMLHLVKTVLMNLSHITQMLRRVSKPPI